MRAIIVDKIRDSAIAGSIEPRNYEQHRGVAYRCPGCNQECWLPVNGQGATNGWNATGDWPESITLSPSVLHRPCGWHGHLVSGEWVPV